MDDRYLFKGKRLGNGEWIVGWYEECPLDRGPLTPCIIPSELARSGEFCYVEVDPSTVAPCNDKWISVKDRLPDNSEYDWVLASVQESNGYRWIPRVMEYRQNRDDWYENQVGWLSSHNGLFAVTHWMPLPEPPGEENI